MTGVHRAAEDAREASRAVAAAPGHVKDRVLRDLADALARHAADVLAANAEDLAAAEHAGLAPAKAARLRLTEASLRQLCAGVRQVAAMPDPVGRVTRDDTVPSGLRVQKVRTPLGVIAMIYEARPGVTVDAFALCFKAGNACLLKGGREATRSNETLAAIAHGVLIAHGLPAAALTLLTTTDREELRELLGLSGLIDLVIPRGGEGLIRFVADHSRIPTVQHFRGVCHAYVDAKADSAKALAIVATGKTSAPATCNATECVLVHESAAPGFVPALVKRLSAEGATVRGDDRFRSFAPPGLVEPATDEDWGREYLDLVLAARVVASMDEAIAHIARHTSSHTEAIITEDDEAAERFLASVRSSCVLHNASTRFNDGYQLGLGAEIGISTSRVHAYGPMGLDGLTAERYVVRGTGQTR